MDICDITEYFVLLLDDGNGTGGLCYIEGDDHNLINDLSKCNFEVKRCDTIDTINTLSIGEIISNSGLQFYTHPSCGHCANLKDDLHSIKIDLNSNCSNMHKDLGDSEHVKDFVSELNELQSGMNGISVPCITINGVYDKEFHIWFNDLVHYLAYRDNVNEDHEDDRYSFMWCQGGECIDLQIIFKDLQNHETHLHDKYLKKNCVTHVISDILKIMEEDSENEEIDIKSIIDISIGNSDMCQKLNDIDKRILYERFTQYLEVDDD